MRKLQYSNRVFALAVSALMLTSCSSSNVSSEWDCPRQRGHGCINIEQADVIALQKLSERSQIEQNHQAQVPDEEAEIPSNVATISHKPGRLQEIWFAPYVDSSGHLHEASIIKYRLVQLERAS